MVNRDEKPFSTTTISKNSNNPSHAGLSPNNSTSSHSIRNSALIDKEKSTKPSLLKQSENEEVGEKISFHTFNLTTYIYQEIFLNINHVENVQNLHQDIEDAHKSVFMEEIETKGLKYIHGMLSVTYPSDTDQVTCIHEICTVERRSRFSSLKSTKTVLIFDGSHLLDRITELSKKVDDGKLS